MDDAEALDDLDAVRRVLSGDRNAFRILVDRYGDRVLRFCRARLLSEEEAADAAQDVFLRAYRSLHHFRAERNFASWLFATAANRIRTRRVRAGSERMRIEAAGVEAAIAETGRALSDPSEEALRGSEVEALREAVAALPPDLRRVVEFYYFAELSVRDTGSILGIGEEAVKSRLFRARKKLRSFLEKGQRPATGRGI